MFPEALHNYQTSDTMQGSTFVANIDVPPDGKSAGKMPSISKGIQIKARNPINVGEQFEWITPEGTFHFKLTELQDKTGLPIEDLQTNQVGVIPKLPKALAHLSEETLRWSLLAKKNAQLTPTAP